MRKSKKIKKIEEKLLRIFPNFPNIKIRPIKEVGRLEITPVIIVQEKFAREAGEEEFIALFVHEYTHLLLNNDEHGQTFKTLSSLLMQVVSIKLREEERIKSGL